MNLDDLIKQTKDAIFCWYESWEGNVYVSFSGGKDSTVLLHIARQMYPDIKGLFINTGLEYPEIVSFVKTKENIVIIRPKKNFKWVIENKGYPVLSKKISGALWSLKNPSKRNEIVRNTYLTGISHNGKNCKHFKVSQKWLYLINSTFKISNACCAIIKHEPIFRFEKQTDSKPMIGMTMGEGQSREIVLNKRQGCNLYDSKRPTSFPLKNWDDQDILQYIKENNIEICSVYGEVKKNYQKKYYTTGLPRTGCMFCMFGVQMEKTPNRFQKMALTHPKQYKYCMETLKLNEVLDYLKIPYKPKGFNF